MRYLFFTIIICLLASCTTAKSMEMSPLQIQEKVNTGELDLIGKQLTLTLRNGVRERIKVSNVTETSIVSLHKEFPYKNIVAFESNEISLVRTAGAAASGTVLTWLGIIVILIGVT